MPFGTLPNSGNPIVSTSQIVLSQKLNIGANDLIAFNQEVDQKAKDLKAKADEIIYFSGVGYAKNNGLSGRSKNAKQIFWFCHV